MHPAKGLVQRLWSCAIPVELSPDSNLVPTLAVHAARMTSLAPGPSRTDTWFRAMGSDVHVVVVDGDDAMVDAAHRRIIDLERRWSRFRPDSEVSRMNAAVGREVRVSPETELLVRLAIEAWRCTGGGFDPLLLHAVQAAGYDRTFAELPSDREELLARSLWVATRPLCADIEVGAGTVALPAGAGFDPGGIGKGLAADIVADELLVAGAAGVCVNMGGDVRVRGVAPGGGAWTVAIEHPHHDAPLALVGLVDGAVATSSVLRRTWRVGHRVQHHLIDPATGEPSTSDVALASVVAGEAWRAEAMTKAVLLRGTARAFDLLTEGTAALAVDRTGGQHRSAAFGTFTSSVPLPSEHR